MKLAAILVALLLIPATAAAMKWDHFRPSTNIEDRQPPPFWTWAEIAPVWVPGPDVLKTKNINWRIDKPIWTRAEIVPVWVPGPDVLNN